VSVRSVLGGRVRLMVGADMFLRGRGMIRPLMNGIVSTVLV